MPLFTRLVLAIASTALLASLAAAAPDEAEQQDSQAERDETKLAPVVVTAQRRSEDAQDVPASISVVDGEALGIYGAVTDDVLLLGVNPDSHQTLQLSKSALAQLTGRLIAVPIFV